MISTSCTSSSTNPPNQKGGRLLNNVRSSFWIIALVAAIILIAFVVSILPQEIIWIIFILMFAALAVLVGMKFWRI
jgi:hypothetical protein